MFIAMLRFMNCTAIWRSSVWGQCSRTCGDGGVQVIIICNHNYFTIIYL
ncbi:unnamed protein product [Onchocerca flexuosa]|uniref:TSP1_CCN domain-containing protein n=1 Tax=Onchocerca flexuosa TaxID=387005 RepID=A0A183HNE5_9BILA|nr:unnamed protein product [Onchocerca flexuosa]